MVAPLEHRDTEPLESILVSLHEQIHREKGFQEAVLWKIRLLERERHYCQRQVTSFSEMLELPRTIAELGKKNQAIDTTLRAQRSRLSDEIQACGDDDVREVAESLLAELDHELGGDRVREHQEAITRILEGYVDTGVRYMEECQSRVAAISRRIGQLEEECTLSRQEEERSLRMHHVAAQFQLDHPGSTYGMFRTHVMRVLGRQMERELKAAIEGLPPA